MDRLMNFISLTKLIISAFAYSLLIEVVSITIVHYVMLSYGYPWRQTWSWDLLDIYPGDSPGFAHMLSPCITVVEGGVDICELKRFEGSSTAESRSKALLVGVRYTGPCMLPQTYLDVNRILDLLKKHGYKDEDIRILLDDSHFPDDRQPNTHNTLKGFEWLTSKVRSGDRRFFYFAGHGRQVEDEDGDEEDGFDETLVLRAHNGPCEDLVDDHIREQLVDKMPAGSRLMTTVDSCCSGSILDLPDRYSTDGTAYKPRNFLDLTNHIELYDNAWSAEGSYTSRTKIVDTKILSDGKELVSSEPQPTVAQRQHAPVKAKVISVSAASDSGKAMGNSRGGVLTRAFCAAMDNETLTFGCSGMVAGTMESSAPYTYGEFFGRITQSLDNFNRSTNYKYCQNPEFWTGGPVDLSEVVQL